MGVSVPTGGAAVHTRGERQAPRSRLMAGAGSWVQGSVRRAEAPAAFWCCLPPLGQAGGRAWHAQRRSTCAPHRHSLGTQQPACRRPAPQSGQSCAARTGAPPEGHGSRWGSGGPAACRAGCIAQPKRCSRQLCQAHLWPTATCQHTQQGSSLPTVVTGHSCLPAAVGRAPLSAKLAGRLDEAYQAATNVTLTLQVSYSAPPDSTETPEPSRESGAPFCSRVLKGSKLTLETSDGRRRSAILPTSRAAFESTPAARRASSESSM